MPVLNNRIFGNKGNGEHPLPDRHITANIDKERDSKECR